MSRVPLYAGLSLLAAGACTPESLLNLSAVCLFAQSNGERTNISLPRQYTLGTNIKYIIKSFIILSDCSCLSPAYLGCRAVLSSCPARRPPPRPSPRRCPSAASPANSYRSSSPAHTTIRQWSGEWSQVEIIMFKQMFLIMFILCTSQPKLHPDSILNKNVNLPRVSFQALSHIPVGQSRPDVRPGPFYPCNRR